MTYKMTWREEQTKRLIVLWTNGDSASQIGAELGFSRNAVIGKVHRLKLSGRSQAGGRPKGSTKPWVLTPKVAIMRMQKHPRVNVELAEPPPTFVPHPKTLMELEDDQCRWPIGALYCGCATARRHSYCGFHDRGAHVVQRRRS